jgi:hypothetical protein
MAMSSARSFLTAALSVCMLACAAGPGTASAQSTDNVEVAIIYNIIRFVAFPDPNPSLKLCAREDDGLAGSLRPLQGRSASGRRIEVVLLHKFDDAARACDVIYAGSSPADRLPPARRGQLQIGDDPHFIDQGGTIGLIRFGGQIRFGINRDTATHSAIQLSAQLMQLAARVVN